MGIAFFYEFDVGNKHFDNPQKNIVSWTSQAEGDFSIENITSESTRHRWRSANVLTEQVIVLKAEQASAIDTIALLGHNFSEEASIFLEANIDDNWIAPPVKIRLPWSEDNIVYYTDQIGNDNSYYRIRVLDPTNQCGHVELGRFMAGRSLTLADNNEDMTDSYSIAYKDMSEKMKMQGFFAQSNENVLMRSLSASFSKLETRTGFDENYVNLRSMFRYVKTTKPFLFIQETNNPNKLNIWGLMKDIPNDSFGIGDYVSFGFKMEEVF